MRKREKGRRKEVSVGSMDHEHRAMRASLREQGRPSQNMASDLRDRHREADKVALKADVCPAVVLLSLL